MHLTQTQTVVFDEHQVRMLFHFADVMDFFRDVNNAISFAIHAEWMTLEI
jgi:hypothetical protein